MFKRRSQLLRVWFLFWDLATTAAAWVAAYYLRFETGLIPLHKDAPPVELCWRNLPLVALLAAVAYRLTGQYAIHRLRRLREEVVCVLKGTALLTLLVMAITFCLHDPYESRAAIALFALLTAAGVLVTRRLSWAAIRHLRSQGYNQTHAVIVGTG